METFLPMLKNVILFVLLAIPGFIFVKTKVMSSESSVVVSKLLVYLGSPFFVVASMLNVDFGGETAVGAILSILIYCISIVLFYFLSIIFSIIRNKDQILRKQKSNMMRFCEIFSNCGFMGLPLALAVFPDNSSLMAFLIICNICGNIFMYTMGASLTSDVNCKINFKKILLNPVLIAFVISIPLNIFKVKNYIPEIETYSVWFNNIVTPLAMTVLGMKMGSVKFLEILKNSKVYIVGFAKLIVFPMLGVVIAILVSLLLPAQKFNLVMCAFICFATPTAAMASTMADQYGGDKEGTALYTLGTTLLSVITIPLLYMLVLCLI